jgi:drug/metabolite transporter (DMT)-like permease
MVARQPVVLASAWMTGALFSFMAMAISGRELSAELGVFEILFFRSLIGLAVISLILRQRRWHGIRTGKIGLHSLRNLAHFGGQYGWFYGISLIPLAEVFAIEFTVPVWTAILSFFILGERLTRSRVGAILLGLTGVLVILRPGFGSITPVTLIVLLSALGYALSHSLTKKLTSSETPLIILFYMTLIQLPLGLAPALGEWVTPSTAMLPWLLLVSLSALSAHYCMSRALMHADATVVVPMDFLRLPLISMVGLWWYGEALDLWLFAGALFIVGGNLLNIHAEKSRSVVS